MMYMPCRTMIVCLGLSAVTAGQTCPRPAAECSSTLHCGGEWDFEAGFYFTSHHLAGQCAGPPGGGNVFCIPADKWAHVAVGWTHWASFPTWETGGYWGTCSFNENKNCDNVFRGNRSQELTMTCANGIGVIYKSAVVPVSHRIGVEAYMKFTPNGDAPDVEHAIGIDPSGGTNPASSGVQWTLWQEQTPSPPQPAGAFNKGTAEAVSLGPTITVFIRQQAFEPPCQGQTFMIDNVRILDLGPAAPTILVQPGVLQPSAIIGTHTPSQTIEVSNSGSGTLDYSIADDAPWLGISPSAGSSSGETDAITVSFATAGLPIGTHTAVITVSADGATNTPQSVPVSLTVKGKPGDYDHDGDVDQADFGLLQRCVTGDSIIQNNESCAVTDLDGDLDVDRNDFSLFWNCLSGPDTPSDPACAD